MSRDRRLAAAATRIQPATTTPQLGLNSAGIPGGVGSVHLDEPIVVAGAVWDPADGDWATGAPIGAALALEMAGTA